MIRVLLVEDESCVAESLVALLRAGGMETVRCATAEEALDATPGDVVVADLELPGISGVELLSRLKDRDAALPVLLLAGPGTIDDAVGAMRAGALDFMRKPIDPDVVVERLRKVVEQARARCASDTLNAEDFEPLLPAEEDDLNLRRRLEAFERRLFRDALRRAGGKKSAAARLLGIDPSNWAYHAKRLHLQ